MLVVLMASCMDDFSFTLCCWVDDHYCSCHQPHLMFWAIKFGAYIQKDRHKHIKDVDAHTHKMQTPPYIVESPTKYTTKEAKSPIKSLIL
jgi:hypothetical protein